MNSTMGSSILLFCYNIDWQTDHAGIVVHTPAISQYGNLFANDASAKMVAGA